MSTETKREDTCELCGYRSDLGAVGKHYIVPTKFTEQAGMRRSQILRLCRNCQQELDTWYSREIARIAYDPRTKQFRTKSSLEVVKEYQSVFGDFAKYKKEQRKRTKRV